MRIAGLFEAIRANRSHVMKIGFFFFLRIDSRESPRFALRIAGPPKVPKSGIRSLGIPQVAGAPTSQLRTLIVQEAVELADTTKTMVSEFPSSGVLAFFLVSKLCVLDFRSS